MPGDLLPVLFKILETLPLPKGQPLVAASGPKNKISRDNQTEVKNEKGQEKTSLPLKTAAGAKRALDPDQGSITASSREKSGVFPGIREDPALFPLPLKSPFFQDAGFYLVPHQGERESPEQKKELTLLVVFKTVHLGILRLFLNHHPDGLALYWLIQTEDAKKRLESIFPDLAAELRQTGYPAVTLQARLLPAPGEDEAIPSSQSGRQAPGRPARKPSFDSYI